MYLLAGCMLRHAVRVPTMLWRAKLGSAVGHVPVRELSGLASSASTRRRMCSVATIMHAVMYAKRYGGSKTGSRPGRDS